MTHALFGRALSGHGATERMRYKLPTHWIRDRPTMPLVNHDLYVQAAIDQCVACGGRRLIEVGCGDGWNSHLLAKMGFEVVGTDFNQNAIDWARRMAPSVSFYCGDLTNVRSLLPNQAPFDIALAVEVIEHIPPEDCSAAIANIRSLVREAGHLVVTVPSTNLPMKNPEHYRHFSRELLTSVIEDGGHWKIEWIGGCGNIDFFNRFLRWQHWFDNRWVHVRALEKLLFRRYLLAGASENESKWMNVVARAVAL